MNGVQNWFQYAESLSPKFAPGVLKIDPQIISKDRECNNRVGCGLATCLAYNPVWWSYNKDHRRLVPTSYFYNECLQFALIHNENNEYVQ